MGFLDYIDKIEDKYKELENVKNVVVEKKVEKKNVEKQIKKIKPKAKKIVRKIVETPNYKNIARDHAVLILDGLSDNSGGVVDLDISSETSSEPEAIPKNVKISELSTKNHASLLL